MNDLNVIDRFLDAFIRYIDSGFGLLGGDVGFLTSVLIGIDITLAGLFWAMGGEDNIIGRFIKKILYIGAFALILNSFSTLTDIIFRSFAGLGLVAGGGLLLSSGLASGLLWQSMQARVVPYVVEVDRLGAAQSIAAIGTDYQPTDPQIAWHLSKFVQNVRSVSLNPVLVRENWLAAYDYATDKGALFLSEYARSANPFAEIGRKTVAVQVSSVVRASNTSFQVKWRESLFERGNLASTSEWTAILTTRIQTPKSAEVLRKNPLGLYVDAVAWSRELETLAVPQEPAAETVAEPTATSVGPEAIPTTNTTPTEAAPPDTANANSERTAP